MGDLKLMRGAAPRPAMKAHEVADALGLKRSTVYTIPWLRQRAFSPTGRGWRWDPADIELFKELRRVGAEAA